MTLPASLSSITMNPSQYIPIEWTYQREENTGRYIGWCESLHITLECDSASELFASIYSSIGVMLKSFTRHGDMRHVAKAKEWPSEFTETIAALQDQQERGKDITPRLVIKPL